MHTQRNIKYVKICNLRYKTIDSSNKEQRLWHRQYGGGSNFDYIPKAHTWNNYPPGTHNSPRALGLTGAAIISNGAHAPLSFPPLANTMSPFHVYEVSWTQPCIPRNNETANILHYTWLSARSASLHSLSRLLCASPTHPSAQVDMICLLFYLVIKQTVRGLEWQAWMRLGEGWNCVFSIY